MEQQAGTRKSQRLVALFVASTLVLGGAAGCSNASNGDCIDNNQDGYCDNGSGSRSGYYYGGSSSSSKSGSVSSDSSSGISKGSHGGIGSSGSSSS